MTCVSRAAVEHVETGARDGRADAAILVVEVVDIPRREVQGMLHALDAHEVALHARLQSAHDRVARAVAVRVAAHAVRDGEERHVGEIAVFVGGSPVARVGYAVPGELDRSAVAGQGHGVAHAAASEGGHGYSGRSRVLAQRGVRG